jgi:hypothetical protein
MKPLRYIAVLFLALPYASVANAQIFYDNTGSTAISAAYATTDEIADDTPFTGTEHVASFTFEYSNQNSTPIDATVRFYTVNPSTGHVGDLMATIPITGLAPGSHQFMTVNLDSSQQFDWTATPGIYGLSSVSGGFVSFQFTGPLFNAGWYEASGASLDGFFDVTTGQFITFQGDTAASFYLQLSGSAEVSKLSAIQLKPVTVAGGANVLARVTLTAPAPAGGALVKLMSSKPTVARIPANVIIPAGATSAIITIKTNPVQSATKVSVSAAFGGVLKVATLSVTP